MNEEEFLDESELELGDVEAAGDFVWQVLFLTPIELIYIGFTMTVLAFYGLSIYYVYKKIQKKFS
jgi:hypothetical protein|tara:strand:- start:1617 stop:1811 length:195 start_codon:yes stop_codon:yes gene_type:complete